MNDQTSIGEFAATSAEHAQKLGSGQVVRPWASGIFTQMSATTGRDETLVMCKLGWWTGVPWDVR